MTRISQERTERHETPTRTMSRQERTSHRRGNLCTSSRGRFSFLDCTSLSTRRSWERFHIARIHLTSNRERLVGRELVSESTSTQKKWAIPPRCIRTASVSDAAVDLDRPDGSTQGRFLVRFTTSEITFKWNSTTLTDGLVG